MRRLPRDRVSRVAAKALAAGGRWVGSSTIEWNLHGPCTSPRCVELVAGNELRRERSWVYRVSDYELTWRGQRLKREIDRIRGVTGVRLTTRCRKCEPCGKARAAHWRYRIKAEVAAARRTWFGTLTAAPQVHSLWLNQCRSAYSKSGDFDALPEPERFARHARRMGAEVTLFFKRSLKNSRASIRRLVVTEAHESGLPHVHCLVHEGHGPNAILHRTLKDAWEAGFSDFELVDSGGAAAAYVAKYLAKAALVRVRASRGYGGAMPVL